MKLRCPLFYLIFCIGAGLGCSPVKSQSTLKESWNPANDPAQLGEYIFNFDALPAEGQHNGDVWSGEYWPSYLGGVAQRWQASFDLQESTAYPLLKKDEIKTAELRNLSPAEKYDIYRGDYKFTLTKWERKRTRALAAIEGTDSYIPGFSIPPWEGLCHGWAPSTISFPEPKPVIMSNPEGLAVPFGSADIKALLSLLMHEGLGADYRFLGRRCEADFAELQLDLDKGSIDQKTYDSIVQSLECRDTNAGSFHVVLANELGRNHTGFLADMRRDQEVWNQGIYSFASTFGEVKPGKSPGASPATVFEVEVSTSVDYIQEVVNAWEAQGTLDNEIFGQAEYRYRLELNEAHEIVGGEWLDEDRPDFLWKISRPRASRILSQLPDLYKASTSDTLFSL